MARQRTGIGFYRRPLAALLLVLLAAALTGAPSAPAAEAAEAVVAAADGTLTSGAPGLGAAFPITVAGVENLGAASVLVGYDPARLKPVAWQRGPAFDVGARNLAYDRDGDGTADAVL